MADTKKWFKVWSTILIDPHHSNMALEDVGRWTRLGAMIVSAGNAGRLDIIAPAKSFLAAVDCPDLASAKCALSRLPNVQIEEGKSDNVSFTVIMQNWFKYQVDSTAHERVKRSRYKRRAEESRGEEKRKESKSYTPKPAVGELIDFFHLKLTEALREKPPHFNGGALGRTLKAALDAHPVEDVKGRIENWFRSTDPFVVANGYSPTLFGSKFPLLRGGPLHGIDKSSSGRGAVVPKAAVGKYAEITENG